MANYHTASARNPDAPLDAEKLLFAADLVHFAISTKWPIYASRPKNVNGSESYRESIYNAFTGDIKDAVQLLVERHGDSVEEKFEEYVKNNNTVTKESFEGYAAEYFKECSLRGEFNFRALLNYFVRVSLLAGHYLTKGIEDAPEIATNLLVLQLPRDFFENSEFWDNLNAVARDILGNNNEDEEPRPPALDNQIIEFQEY